MLTDRGIAVDHTTLYRWIQAYAPELDQRLRPHLRLTTGSWRVDKTYVRVGGTATSVCTAGGTSADTGYPTAVASELGSGAQRP